MKCPRCESIVLDEKTRDGVVIDACRECRGVWLDRGELEKLIHRALSYEDSAPPPLPQRGRESDERGWRDDDDDDDRGDRNDRDDRSRGGRRRRGGIFDAFGDLFD